jgi:hypothetical protein
VRLSGPAVRLNASAAWVIASDRAVEGASRMAEGLSRAVEWFCHAVESICRAVEPACRVGKSVCRGVKPFCHAVERVCRAVEWFCRAAERTNRAAESVCRAVRSSSRAGKSVARSVVATALWAVPLCPVQSDGPQGRGYRIYGSVGQAHRLPFRSCSGRRVACTSFMLRPTRPPLQDAATGAVALQDSDPKHLSTSAFLLSSAFCADEPAAHGARRGGGGVARA